MFWMLGKKWVGHILCEVTCTHSLSLCLSLHGSSRFELSFLKGHMYNFRCAWLGWDINTAHLRLPNLRSKIIGFLHTLCQSGHFGFISAHLRNKYIAFLNEAGLLHIFVLLLDLQTEFHIVVPWIWRNISGLLVIFQLKFSPLDIYRQVVRANAAFSFKILELLKDISNLLSQKLQILHYHNWTIFVFLTDSAAILTSFLQIINTL